MGDIAHVKLEKHDTKDINDKHVNGSLTVIWRDWDKIIEPEPKMVYISSVWTIMSWYNNNRTVEIHVKNDYNDYNEYDKKTVTNFDSFCVLTYDVIFEIGIAYMFFYNLCTPLNIYGE